VVWLIVRYCPVLLAWSGLMFAVVWFTFGVVGFICLLQSGLLWAWSGLLLLMASFTFAMLWLNFRDGLVYFWYGLVCMFCVGLAYF